MIVGAGIYGAVFAEQMTRNKKKCLIIDKRSHIAGNCYTKKQNNIDVHVYGCHIFHTNKKEIWDYVNKFCEFNNYKHTVKVKYKNKVFSFPINLLTLHQIWGVTSPDEALKKLENVKIKIDTPKNMEEWCLANIGKELYEIFVKGYSIKQWNEDPKNLPASIVKRIPIRLNFNDNYYEDGSYQGIPKNGYTEMVQNMIEKCDLDLEVDFFKIKDWKKYAKKLIFCGPIDQFFNYEFGKLDYRSLRWESEWLNGDFQGCSQVNYTEQEIPYTRITEHKHFNNKNQDKTFISKEYPANYSETNEPYYPINNFANNEMYSKYKRILEKNNNILISGRLGKYKYLDMDDCVALAISESVKELS